MGSGSGKGVEAVLEGKGHTLHHGLRHRGAVGFMRQADEGTPGGGIIMRGAFAGKIGKEGDG